jgi:sugar phosphate isomerase/epimerase
MNEIKQSLAVQSWSFRAFKTVPALVEQLKKVGVSATELCGVHANFDDEAQFNSVIGQFKSAGIQIVSIGVQYLKGDEAKEEKWFKFAKAAGAKRISISLPIDNHLAVLKMAEKLGDKYDLYCGIHNHGGYDWLGSRAALGYIFKNSSKRVGLTMDAAWCLQAGENPIQMAEQFIDRLYGVHFKDFVFDRAGKGHDVVVGEGNLDLKKLIDLAKTKAPANCVSIIEYEADEANPAPAITKCVEAIRALA